MATNKIIYIETAEMTANCKLTVTHLPCADVWQIPSVPLKDMRNIFESLAQHALAHQQHMLVQKKPSKWDKRPEQKLVDIVQTDDGQDTSLDHQMQSDVDADRELVHGSSTVFVLEDELPPPAFTKNIVAKFRELEASNAVTSPDKMTPSPPRSAYSRSSQSESHDTRSPANQTAWHSSATTDDDMHDGSEFRKSAGRQNSDERGRSEKRSEVRQRESSNSPGWSAASELPQEGTARTLLSRWRTIEQQASRTSEVPAKRSSTAAKRSQSTSRLEVRRHHRATQPSADEDADEGLSASTRYFINNDKLYFECVELKIHIVQ